MLNSHQLETDLVPEHLWFRTGYAVLDNAEALAVVFPFVPGIIHVRANTNRLHLDTSKGSLVLDKLPASAQSALINRGVLMVGVDALLRPVFEHWLPPGCTRQ